MTQTVHRSAPLSVEVRRRLIEHCRTRQIADLATEMGISRACASKWVTSQLHPARTVIRVAFHPLGAVVEIDLIATGQEV
ncbi:RidA family protein [Streptomyces sp. NBC_01727]|uniref:RidA family protein n=1 Tax=Streptomyces sp. NBC_01727 TaxID=2975924 RepID=UPI002E12D1A6|nr:RidA family protein [Streptomyces sp. NBC_01727]